MRSAEASKNTSTLIKNSMAHSKVGEKFVNRVAEMLKKISSSSDKVGKAIQKMAVASDEQFRGVLEINSAVDQVDKITQKIAANAQVFYAHRSGSSIWFWPLATLWFYMPNYGCGNLPLSVF